MAWQNPSFFEDELLDPCFNTNTSNTFPEEQAFDLPFDNMTGYTDFELFGSTADQSITPSATQTSPQDTSFPATPEFDFDMDSSPESQSFSIPTPDSFGSPASPPTESKDDPLAGLGLDFNGYPFDENTMGQGMDQEFDMDIVQLLFGQDATAADARQFFDPIAAPAPAPVPASAQSFPHLYLPSPLPVTTPEGADLTPVATPTPVPSPSPALSSSTTRAPRQPPQKRSAFACPEPGCGKIFPRQCDLRKHKKRHIKPFLCREEDGACGSAFSTEKDRDRHERCKHRKEEHLRCTMCGHRNARKDNMKDHVKRRHGAEVVEEVMRSLGYH